MNPRRTLSIFKSETSDYRINASQIIKENSSIRKYYKEKSKNIAIFTYIQIKEDLD